MKTTTSSVRINISQDYWKKLKVMAIMEDTDIATIAGKALEEYLDKPKPNPRNKP